MKFDHEKYPKRDYVIVGGKRWKCAAPVVQFADSGLEVKVGKGSRRRCHKTAIDLFALHWTGGENDIRTLFRVLESRELAVEFAIDRDGVIWQFCDPALVDTFDAGVVNKRSVGVEIVNYGFVWGANRVLPAKGRDRGTYRTELHGRARTFARFYPNQLRAANALIDTVLVAIPTIPRSLPLDAHGELKRRALTSAELAKFKGVIGHFHVTANKADPGTDIFESVEEHWRASR